MRPPNQGGANPSRSAKMLGEALALLRAGQPAKAGEICDAVLAFDPGQPDALHMGGIVALQTGRLDKAIEVTRKVYSRRDRLFTDADEHLMRYVAAEAPKVEFAAAGQCG